jgi:hypothetical protein
VNDVGVASDSHTLNPHSIALARDKAPGKGPEAEQPHYPAFDWILFHVTAAGPDNVRLRPHLIYY